MNANSAVRSRLYPMKYLLGALVGLAILAVAGYELYTRGYIRFNYPDATRFPVRGIDVSHHQGTIDWPAVKASGVEFAFIKASEGGDHRDREFPKNWAAARQAGIVRGAYHFFTFCTPGIAQADNLGAALAGMPGELPPMADIEFSGNCTQWKGIAEIRSELKLFVERVQEVTQRRPILYFTGDVHSRILDGHFPGYALWPRNVLREPSDLQLGHWLFWQFADNGRIRGVKTLVDLDVFRGSRSDFESFLVTPPANER